MTHVRASKLMDDVFTGANQCSRLGGGTGYGQVCASDPQLRQYGKGSHKAVSEHCERHSRLHHPRLQ